MKIQLSKAILFTLLSCTSYAAVQIETGNPGLYNSPADNFQNDHQTKTQLVGFQLPAVSDPVLQKRWHELVKKLAKDYQTDPSTPTVTYPMMLHYLASTIEIQETPAYASMTLKRNPDGTIIQQPVIFGIKVPKAVLGFGRESSSVFFKFYDQLDKKTDQTLMEIYLKGHIVKELNGYLEYYRDPNSTVAERFLFKKINAQLESFKSPQGGYSLKSTDLDHTLLSEMIKTFTAMTLHGEGVGYAENLLYFRDKNLDSKGFLRLAQVAQEKGQNQLALLFQIEAQTIESAPLSRDDIMKETEIQHVIATLNLFKKGIIGLKNQAVIFNFANEIEMIEGRGSQAMTNVFGKLPDNVRIKPPAPYLNYIVDPTYYQLTLDDLKKKFGN